MTSFKKSSFSLIIALGLLGAACGDDEDKKDDGTNMDVDAGGDAGGESNQCVGGYAGFTLEEIATNIKDEAGACANEADIDGVCKLSPSDRAREVGLPCFLSVSGNQSLSDEEKAMMTGDCALNGKGTQEGLKTILEGMSDTCISCYVDAVICAAQKCIAPCGAGTAAECDACRDEQGCTSDFFTCSGLPSTSEITEAAK
jgi:hypothetical protein